MTHFTCLLYIPRIERYVVESLKLSLRKYFGRYGDLINHMRPSLQNDKCHFRIWLSCLLTLPHVTKSLTSLPYMYVRDCDFFKPLQRSWGGGGYTGFTMSFRLWKSGFCTITPFPFDIQWWYFTDVLTMTRRPLLIFGCLVKGQGKIWTSNFSPFPHDNSISVSHSVMILHTCVDYVPRRTSIGFGGRKVKGRGQIWTYILLFPHDNCFSFCPTMMVLHTCVDYDPRPLLILRLKCQMWRSNPDFKLCNRIHTITLLSFDLQ